MKMDTTIIVVLSLLVHSAVGLDGFPQVGVQHEYGVGFHMTDDRHFAAAETVTISWVMDFPYESLKLNPIKKPHNVCPEVFPQCHREYGLLIKELELCNQYMSQVTDNIREINNYMNEFNKENFNNFNRQRRGALDIAGDLMQALFGTATSSDIQNLREEIFTNTEILRELSENVDANHNDLNERMAAQGSRINILWQGLNASHLEILNVRDNLITFRQEMAETTKQLHDAISNANHILHYQQLRVSVENRHLELFRLQIECTKLIGIMETLHKHQLPPSLVSRPSIKQALHKVIEKLVYEKSPLRPITQEEYLYKYYEIKTTNTVRVGHKLIITLAVPITEVQTPFNIYSVQNIGVKLSANSELGYSKIKDMYIPQYLAVTLDQRYFAPLNERQVQICATYYNGFCPYLNIMYDALSNLCIIKLFNGDLMGIKEHCKVNLYPNDQLSESIVMISSGKYLITNPSTKVLIDCNAKGKWYVEILNQKLVSVPCGCRVVVGSLRTMISTYNCNGTLKEVRINYNLNAILAANFDQEDLITHHNNHLHVSKERELKLPPLSNYVQEYHALTATDNKLVVDLEKWKSATMSNKSVVTKDKQLEKRIKHFIAHNKPRYELTWKDYIYISLHTLAIIILTVYGYKLHTLGLINVLEKLPKTSATVYNSLQQVHAATTPAPATPDTNTLHVLETCFKVFLLLAALGLAIERMTKVYNMVKSGSTKMYKLCQACFYPRQTNKSLEIFAKIYDGYRSIFVYLTEIDIESGRLQVLFTPRKPIYYVSASYIPTVVNFQWDRPLELEVNDKNVTVTLPTTIMVSPFIRQKLNELYAKQTNKLKLYTLSANLIISSDNTNKVVNGTYYPLQSKTDKRFLQTDNIDLDTTLTSDHSNDDGSDARQNYWYDMETYSTHVPVAKGKQPQQYTKMHRLSHNKLAKTPNVLNRTSQHESTINDPTPVLSRRESPKPPVIKTSTTPLYQKIEYLPQFSDSDSSEDHIYVAKSKQKTTGNETSPTEHLMSINAQSRKSMLPPTGDIKRLDTANIYFKTSNVDDQL